MSMYFTLISGAQTDCCREEAVINSGGLDTDRPGRHQVLTGQELQEGWVRLGRSSEPERGDGGYQPGWEKRKRVRWGSGGDSFGQSHGQHVSWEVE